MKNWYINFTRKHPMRAWLGVSIVSFFSLAYIFSISFEENSLFQLVPILSMPLIGGAYTIYISKKIFDQSCFFSILSLLAYPYLYLISQNDIDFTNSYLAFGFLFLSGLGTLFIFEETTEQKEESSWIELMKAQWYIFFPIILILLMLLSFYIFWLFK